jgi:magnesium chelatase family protein
MTLYKNSVLAFPETHLTLKVAPADLRKEGPAYNLPIAPGILIANQHVWADVSSSLFVGERSLDDTSAAPTPC